MIEDNHRWKLPVRFVAPRGRVILIMLFLLVWTSGSTFMLAMLSPVLVGEPSLLRVTGQPLPAVCTAIAFVLLGLYFLGRSFLHALPGSPYAHLEIGANGLTHRHFFRTQAVGWDEILRFVIVDRMEGAKRKVQHWWVLVETPDRRVGGNVDRMIDKAALAYDANDLTLLETSGEAAAEELLDLLDKMLTQFRAGQLPEAIILPPTLARRAIAIEAPVVKAGSHKQEPRRNSVVER
jgi:hypothetical protein